ncbi:MAG: LpxL/LpxP family acyltransferase [Planctomycetota bacterium]|jgi:predicted LPLAT superfamily acyltransferase
MADGTTHPRSPDYGGHLGHAIFHWLIRWLGVRPAYVLLALVVPYYVIFRRSARQAAAPYLRHRFPQLSSLERFMKTVRYFYTFGQVLIDQAAMGILGPEYFTVELPGSETLHGLAHNDAGLVLLTSHAGGWQTAMAKMDALETPVHFQLQLEPHTAGRHFFDLAGQSARFHVISPSTYLGGMVELAHALHVGECVAVMGDRAWGGRTRTTPFLGEPAAFPIAPYRLALAAEADLVVLLTVRTGKCAYRIEQTRITKPADPTTLSREESVDALLRAYVRCLEDYVARYPLMWFNLFDFWNPGRENASSP